MFFHAYKSELTIKGRFMFSAVSQKFMPFILFDPLRVDLSQIKCKIFHAFLSFLSSRVEQSKT